MEKKVIIIGYEAAGVGLNAALEQLHAADFNAVVIEDSSMLPVKPELPKMEFIERYSPSHNKPITRAQRRAKQRRKNRH